MITGEIRSQIDAIWDAFWSAEGLIVPSARLTGGINVIVFHTHLLPGSSIVAHNENAIPFVHGL